MGNNIRTNSKGKKNPSKDERKEGKAILKLEDAAEKEEHDNR